MRKDLKDKLDEPPCENMWQRLARDTDRRMICSASRPHKSLTTNCPRGIL